MFVNLTKSFVALQVRKIIWLQKGDPFLQGLRDNLQRRSRPGPHRHGWCRHVLQATGLGVKLWRTERKCVVFSPTRTFAFGRRLFLFVFIWRFHTNNSPTALQIAVSSRLEGHSVVAETTEHSMEDVHCCSRVESSREEQVVVERGRTAYSRVHRKHSILYPLCVCTCPQG